MSLEPCASGRGRDCPVTGQSVVGHLAMAAALLLLVMLCGAPASAVGPVSVLPMASAAAEDHHEVSRSVRREDRGQDRSLPAHAPPAGGTLRPPVAARHRQLPPIRAP